MKLIKLTPFALLGAAALHAGPTLIGSAAVIDYVSPDSSTIASSLTTLTIGGVPITINDYFNLDGTSGVSGANILAGNYVTETIRADASGYYLSCPGADIGTAVCLNFREPTTIAIGASSITIHEACGAGFLGLPFAGLDFTGLDFGPGYSLSGYTLTTDLAGLTAADVSFTGNSIEYNAGGLGFYNSPYAITLELDASATTPEPGTFALFGLVCAGLGSLKLFRAR